MTECEHPATTRIGNSNLIKCAGCGKVKYVEFPDVDSRLLEPLQAVQTEKTGNVSAESKGKG
jgi:hypothetical protein